MFPLNQTRQTDLCLKNNIVYNQPLHLLVLYNIITLSSNTFIFLILPWGINTYHTISKDLISLHHSCVLIFVCLLFISKTHCWAGCRMTLDNPSPLFSLVSEAQYCNTVTEAQEETSDKVWAAATVFYNMSEGLIGECWCSYFTISECWMDESGWKGWIH